MLFRSATALPRHSEHAVEGLIARAATDGERVVSLIRAAIVTAHLTRSIFFIWIPYGAAVPQILPALFAGGLGIGFSVWVLVWYRQRVAPKLLFWISVSLDVLISSGALLLNPLFPGPGYPGLLFMPDMLGQGIIVIAAGFRLSKGATLFGGALALACSAGILVVDEVLGGPVIAENLQGALMFGIVLVAASGVGLIIAWRTRTLVVQGALQAVEAERAERNLGALLQDHHDVRTILSSAALNADLLVRGIAGEREESAEELGALARELRSDLGEVNDFISGIKERAYDEISAMQVPVPVDVRAAVQEVVQQLEQRFPAVEIETEVYGDAVHVWVSGGASTLRRVLWNLVVNACEGDGTQRADRVTIIADGDAATVRFRIEDNGPGFPPDVLATPIGARTTTKADGSGLGLVLVETLLGSNAVTLQRENRPTGGASVRFELPVSQS